MEHRDDQNPQGLEHIFTSIRRCRNGYWSTIRIALVDTGIYYKHPDLKGSVTWCVVSLRNTKTLYEGTDLRNCDDPTGTGPT